MEVDIMNKKAILEKLGIEELRETQRAPVQAILGGNDTLVMIPTGGGKSFIYQYFALAKEGSLTVVISPIIALQRDQITALEKKDIRARLLNSSLSDSERKRVLQEVKSGELVLLYIAPEQLKNSEVREALEVADIAQVAVDEAHILAHDQYGFRKAYAEVGDFIDCLPRRPVVTAFTATATKQNRKIIIESLRMQEPKVFVEPVRRANLQISIKIVDSDSKDDRRAAVWREKRCAVETVLKDWDGEGSVIVYCSTVKAVKKLSKWLKAEGWKAGKYHGKMSDKKRTAAQANFLSGKTKFIVATNAFGLGIDKPDVRLIIHVGLPLSMDGFVQEIGRAGRDGKEAQCVLIYAPSDLAENKATLRHGLNEEQRNAAFMRLDALYHMVCSDKCLWREIERYFGEKRGKKCKKCCNCKKAKHKKV